MFKIGQKVRVKEWKDMPQEIEENWGISECTGEIGIIKSQKEKEEGHNAYDVKLDNNKYSGFYFEEELESIVKIGEQLLLFEL